METRRMIGVGRYEHLTGSSHLYLCLQDLRTVRLFLCISVQRGGFVTLHGNGPAWKFSGAEQLISQSQHDQLRVSITNVEPLHLARSPIWIVSHVDVHVLVRVRKTMAAIQAL